jgi:FdhE protein
LASLYPFAREILEIYQEIATFQSELFEQGRQPKGTEEPIAVLRTRLDKVKPGTARDPGLLERAVAQPLAEREGIASGSEPQVTCPGCGGRPVVGVLREQGHGARRSLICGRCSIEWEYPRVTCASCGRGEPEIYTAEQIPNVRLEVCAECRIYLKTVDLSRNALAVPIVDEIASIPLDLWAQERGYRKLEVNLLGL